MNYTTKQLENELCEKLRLNFGSTVEEATDAQMMKACALVLRDMMAEREVSTRQKTRRAGKRQVHYMSLSLIHI